MARTSFGPAGRMREGGRDYRDMIYKYCISNGFGMPSSDLSALIALGNVARTTLQRYATGPPATASFV